MDVFSDVIASMGLGRAESVRTRRLGEWGGRFGPYRGAGFQVVLQGGCWSVPPVGDPVRLGAGDVVFLPRGAVHGVSDGPGRSLAELQPESPDDDPGEGAPGDTLLLCGAYRVDRGRAHPLLRELPEVVHLPARVGRHPALRAVVDLLGADATDPGPGGAAALPGLLDLLPVYVLRAWLAEESARRPEAGWCAALGDPAIAAALHAVHREPASPWTVRRLADVAGLSRTAFAGRFTALTGGPPLAYLTWWRLSTAARLLRDGDEPLAAVARQAGYTSEYAFANAFKREFGVPPGRFRRERRPAGDARSG